jgi:hypothetical protein
LKDGDDKMAKIETTVVFDTDDPQNEPMYTIKHIFGFPFKGQITKHEWNEKDWIYETNSYIHEGSVRVTSIRVTDGKELYQYNETDVLTSKEYDIMRKRVIKAMKNWNAIKNW